MQQAEARKTNDLFKQLNFMQVKYCKVSAYYQNKWLKRKTG